MQRLARLRYVASILSKVSAIAFFLKLEADYHLPNPSLRLAVHQNQKYEIRVLRADDKVRDIEQGSLSTHKV